MLLLNLFLEGQLRKKEKVPQVDQRSEKYLIYLDNEKRFSCLHCQMQSSTLFCECQESSPFFWFIY